MVREVFMLVGAVAAVLGASVVLAQDRYGDPLPQGATQRLGTQRLRCSISDLCYLPDGRGAFAIGGRVEIWDMAEGRLQSTHDVCKSSLVSIVPRRDGKVLLLADGAGNVHEWELAAARLLRSWPTKQGSLRCVHYSPDETRVLTTGADPPTLKEWELATPKETISITGKMHYFNEGIYGPDGKTALVDGGAGKEPILAHYDLAGGKLLNEWLNDYYTHSRSIVLSDDGKRLLVGSRHKGTEWLLDGYKPLNTFTGHHGHAVTSIAYCKEPDQVLTGSRDGSIRRWNRLEAKVLLRWCPHSNHVTRLAVSPDGKWVLSYGGGLIAETSLATGEPRLKWDRHDDAVEAIAFLPDGKHVVSGSSDGTLRVWDVNTGVTTRVTRGANLGAYAVAVSPDGSKAAAGCKDGVVREFSLADGAQVRELKGHLGYIRSVAYTHDGSRLLSSADDGSIRIWSSDKAEPSAILQGHRGGVLALDVSPDDRRAISGGRDGTVRLWDLAEAKPLRTLEGHLSWVEAVAFCHEGRHALSTGRDARLLRWDLESGKLVREVEHHGRAYALKCNKDDTRAFSAGDNCGVACWDLKSNKLLREMKGHTRTVRGLALSPDGKRVVTASEDTTLLVWGVGEE